MNPALDALMLVFTGETDLPVPAHALFLGAEPHPALKSWPDVTGWQPIKPLADAWDMAGFKRSDHPEEEARKKWPLVLLLPGKSKDETLALFARAYDLLEDGGTIVASMANTAGASRFEKELKQAAGHIASLQKHKCRAFHAVKDFRWNKETVAAWRKLGEVRTVPDTTFFVQAGVFSPDHVDPGSRFLTENLPRGLHGHVADLGAGWGYLSRWIDDHCPGVKRLDLHESDARALDLARRNLADTDIEVRFIWKDVATGLGEAYDAVVMNPPFHIGQSTDVGLGKAFIQSAARALRLGGKLYLVANRQLPYEAELEAAGLAWRKVGEHPTFKLLFAEKRHSLVR